MPLQQHSTVLALSLLVLFLTGCGSRGGGGDVRLKPPTNPGSLEALENSAWIVPGINSLAFHPGERVTFTPLGKNSGNLMPLDGAYTLEAGALTIDIPGIPPLFGTWDGQTVVVQDPRFKIHRYTRQ